MNRDGISYLKERWLTLTNKYSSDEVLVNSFFSEIESAYNSPGRHYHTCSHIKHLLDLSYRYNKQLQDNEIVDFAIFYHDIVYDVSKSDNEERSASIARERMAQFQTPYEKQVEVARYIMASKTHQLDDGNSETDLAWFLDFDMSILGSDWETYLQYLGQVRQEYISYPDKVFAAGRSQFLESTIMMPFIFNTSQFRLNCEQQARLNIQRELSMPGIF